MALLVPTLWPKPRTSRQRSTCRHGEERSMKRLSGRLLAVIVLIAAALGVGVLTAPSASAAALYICKGGELHKITVEQVYDADGNPAGTRTIDEVLRSCVGNWHFSLSVTQPGTDNTTTTHDFGKGGNPTEKSEVATLPGAQELPSEDACSRPTVRGTPENDVIVLYNSANNIVDAGDGNDGVVARGS